MSIILKKEQLAFLEKYAMCVDSKMAINEKFQISYKDNKLIFSQSSNMGYLITSIDYSSINQNNIVFDTIMFVSLIRSIPDNTEITITEKGIEFLGNSYDIVNTDMELGNVDKFLDITKENNINKFILTDIDCFNKIKDYAYGDKLETVSYQNNYFVTSNKLYVTAFSKTKNFILGKDFYFSQETFTLLTEFKIKEIDIFVKDDFYFFKLEETFIFIPKRDYILPNMFQEKIMCKYNHPFRFSVNKKEIKETLFRMKIVAKNNKESRIYFEPIINIQNVPVLTIKNTDTQFAQEDIYLTYLDPEIKKTIIPLSVNYLASIVDKCDGNTLTFYCTNEEDNFMSMKIEDETQNYFYILNLLEK